MKLNLDDLQVASFATAAEEEEVEPALTGQGGPYSLCWLCRPTDWFVPTCHANTCQVDSYCICYA